MKYFIPITLIYLTGINCYFLMWYLGSDGEAARWILGCFSFPTFWWFVNASTVLGFFTFILFQDPVQKYLQSTIRNGFIAFGLQALACSIYFISVFILLSIFIYGPHIVYEFALIGTSGITLSMLLYHHLMSLVVVGLYNLNGRLGISYGLFRLLSRLKSGSRQLEQGFMFIDLNESTTIAEKISSEQYSNLIKNCFELLDELLEGKEGLYVYQYVGDEVILYWDLRNRQLTVQSIELFKAFKQKLLEKTMHFHSTYGLQPTFKCAIHGGCVTHAELGSGITHQAFHGDVLNTTSRMLNISKQLKTDLILSGLIWKALPKDERDLYINQRDVQLSGKSQPMHLYHLEQSLGTDKCITISKSNTTIKNHFKLKNHVHTL